MIVEIKSPTEIRLTAESSLEHEILADKTWSVEYVQPAPMEINAGELKLVAKEGAKL